MVKRKYALNGVFFSLSDPTRRMIVYQISLGIQLSASDIARPHHISSAAISKHLKILEDAGVVRRKKQGKNHLFSLNHAALQEALTHLEVYAQHAKKK